VIIPAKALAPEKNRIGHAHPVEHYREQEEMPVRILASKPIHSQTG
jgi:hypothetical protein